MVADSLPALDILTPLLQDPVGLFPQRLVHNGRNDFPGFVLEHDPFLGGQKLLLFGEQINDLDFVAHIVPLVLRVGDHTGHGRVGDLLPVVISIAFFPKQSFDLLHGILA